MGEVNAHNVTKTKHCKKTGEKQKKLDKIVEKAIPTKEFIHLLLTSRRQIEYQDILKPSKNTGKNWKAVGLYFQDGLKFNAAQLDQFQTDTTCLESAVRRMLYRWLQWKDEEATVGKLAEALRKAKEFDALMCLEP